MFTSLKKLFGSGAPDLKARLIIICGSLAILNIGAWLWALIAFHDRPALIGVALLIYGLGLRHAVDADHIAAIDNVTRKLMQMNERPVATGFFFALGHSALVVIVAAAVAGATGLLAHFQSLQAIGGTLSTAISAFFLFAIAAMNLVIFVAVYRSFKRLRAGGTYVEEDLTLLLANRGILSRIFRPLFKLVSKSWHMVLLGFLFGLGFDTATEVAMFGIAAEQSAHGLPFAAMLVLPALFAAGMSLIDTADGIMMLGAYDWAFVKPVRKLYYNMTITLVSAVVALLIGSVEAFRLIGERLALKGGFWETIGALNEHFNALGFVIIGIFFAAWALSYAIYKMKRLDKLDISSA
jgi:high-affinity nickel-transport protein